VTAGKGAIAKFADIATERLDPPGPTPARCYALGAAVHRRWATGRTGWRWSRRRAGGTRSSSTGTGTCAPTPPLTAPSTSPWPRVMFEGSKS